MPRKSKKGNNIPKKTIASLYTMKMCKNNSRIKMNHTIMTKCDIDHTDSANVKCYHDALAKYNKETKSCKTHKKK
jgi:hypothetical protein